jgi:hypothetical protein
MAARPLQRSVHPKANAPAMQSVDLGRLSGERQVHSYCEIAYSLILNAGINKPVEAAPSTIELHDVNYTPVMPKLQCSRSGVRGLWKDAASMPS